MLLLQNKMDNTVTTWLTTSSAKTKNLDRSNRGIVCYFDGTNQHLLAFKFTVTP